MSEQEKRGDLVKIGALWTSRTKKGDLCLTGKMGDAVLLIFKNQFKEQEKQPDYFAFVAKPVEKEHPKDEGWDDKSSPKAESIFDEERKSDNTPNTPDTYDEIPF